MVAIRPQYGLMSSSVAKRRCCRCRNGSALLKNSRDSMTSKPPTKPRPVLRRRSPSSRQCGKSGGPGEMIYGIDILRVAQKKLARIDRQVTHAT